MAHDSDLQEKVDETLAANDIETGPSLISQPNRKLTLGRTFKFNIYHLFNNGLWINKQLS